jgi:hypothetical protein
MLWVAEWGTIGVLWDDADGRYDAYDDPFDPEKPEPAPLAAADPNLIEPRQGFGKVWRQQHEQERQQNTQHGAALHRRRIEVCGLDRTMIEAPASSGPGSVRVWRATEAS